MSRFITQAFRDAFYGSSTGEAAIVLLTISHPDLAAPIYLALNTQTVSSRGKTFLPYFFQIQLPDQTGDKMPAAQLSVDAVDRALIDTLRGLAVPPEVLIEVVMSSAPNNVVLQTPSFVWRAVKYDLQTMSGDLEGPKVYSGMYPDESFSPSVARGLFKAIG